LLLLLAAAFGMLASSAGLLLLLAAAGLLLEPSNLAAADALPTAPAVSSTYSSQTSVNNQIQCAIVLCV
jgi:hypothetical protein